MKKRTRALFLGPNLALGGVSTWILALFRHCVDVEWVGYCVCQWGSEWNVDEDLMKEVMKTCPVMGIASDAPDRAGKLRQAISDSQADIVVSWCVADLDKFWDSELPLVLVSHGSGQSNAYSYDVLRGPSRIATHLVGISNFACQPFATVAPGRQVQMIYNGVEPAILSFPQKLAARERLGFRRDEIAVGFFARITPEKGPIRLAQAMAMLPENYRGIWCGPPSHGVLDQIRAVYPRAIILPPLPPGEIYDWLVGLDVSCLPSEFESSSYTSKEAWSARVALVATDTGIVNEVGQEVTTVIPLNYSNEQLRDAIIEASRKEKVQAAYELSLKLTAKKMAERWDDYLCLAAMMKRHAGVEMPVEVKIASLVTHPATLEKLSWEEEAVAMLRKRRV